MEMKELEKFRELFENKLLSDKGKSRYIDLLEIELDKDTETTKEVNKETTSVAVGV